MHERIRHQLDVNVSVTKQLHCYRDAVSFMLPPLIGGRVMFSGCLSVRYLRIEFHRTMEVWITT